MTGGTGSRDRGWYEVSGGVVRFPVDPRGERCGAAFVVREDVAEGLRQVLAEVWSRGGVVTSSGSLRRPEAVVHAARSPVSLHYLGRAVDLCLWSGMQALDDPYVVLREGGEDERPRWRVLCVGDPGECEERVVEAMFWRWKVGAVPDEREAAFFDLTEVFARWGWTSIAARAGWRTDYAATEWWHFECHAGLVQGESRFGDELAGVWSMAEVEGTALVRVVDWVWDGGRFVAVE
jgi:hypothetical protein